MDYFRGIFSSSNPSGIPEVCASISGRLNVEQIRMCTLPFSEEEVKDSIFQMHPTKAPGPDGLPALFYQKFWSIVGKDVLKDALDILNNQKDPSDINSTFISLIPKKKNSSLAHEFRPISLCNVIMKAVTKAISNRLKPILPAIISEEQSAFVKDRLITDNALIAMECFHWIKKQKERKKKHNGVETGHIQGI